MDLALSSIDDMEPIKAEAVILFTFRRLNISLAFNSIKISDI